MPTGVYGGKREFQGIGQRQPSVGGVGHGHDLRLTLGIDRESHHVACCHRPLFEQGRRGRKRYEHFSDRCPQHIARFGSLAPRHYPAQFLFRPLPLQQHDEGGRSPNGYMRSARQLRNAYPLCSRVRDKV
jgi:hypothetical protein